MGLVYVLPKEAHLGVRGHDQSRLPSTERLAGAGATQT